MLWIPVGHNSLLSSDREPEDLFHQCADFGSEYLGDVNGISLYEEVFWTVEYYLTEGKQSALLLPSLAEELLKATIQNGEDVFPNLRTALQILLTISAVADPGGPGGSGPLLADVKKVLNKVAWPKTVFSSENALKLTYSKVDCQKFPGVIPPDPHFILGGREIVTGPPPLLSKILDPPLVVLFG